MVMAEVARVERTSRGFRLRLAFGRLLWSVTGVLIVIREAGLWWFLHRMRVGPGPSRLLAMIYYSPGLIFQCLLIGIIVAVAADLIVRLVVRPLAARWYSPREDASSSHPAPFRLGPDEAIELEMPARRRVGRRWLPGTLLGTNRRAWFVPFAWDAEPWSCPWEEVEDVRVLSARRPSRGLLRGWPDPVTIRDGRGDEATFLVAETTSLLDWFDDDRVSIDFARQ